jgi:site-specific DNA recombinase
MNCAIYTRKSTDEGLEQDFNTLDAQREAGEAYITSQKSLGWECMPDRYDDGGISGGTMERPALKRLLEDVDRGKVDIIVVYKIDRLSRSLLDFTRMVEYFNSKGVSFISVTQQISTADSTGRMMLNILMTFAQYEREITTDRIRDKIAAAKRKGKFCGGMPPLGYDVDSEKNCLKVNQDEAKLVNLIFDRFRLLASAGAVARELNAQGLTTKSWKTKKGRQRQGRQWMPDHIYRILNNRTYLGEILHKGKSYNGEHPPIVDVETWDKAHAILESHNSSEKRSASRTVTMGLLKGVLKCGYCGGSMGPTYTQKKDGRRYSYYVCEQDAKRANSICHMKRLPAGGIERAVVEQIGAVFRTPEIISKTLQMCKQDSVDQVTVNDIIDTFSTMEFFWDDLFPAERNRIIRLIVERVIVRESGFDIEIKGQGLEHVVDELRGFTHHLEQ